MVLICIVLLIFKEIEKELFYFILVIITETSFLAYRFSFLPTAVLECTTQEILLSQPEFQILLHTHL